MVYKCLLAYPVSVVYTTQRVRGLRDQTDRNCVGWPKFDPMEEEDPIVFPAFIALGLLHLVDNPPAV
jgi:hypothetical protein